MLDTCHLPNLRPVAPLARAARLLMGAEEHRGAVRAVAFLEVRPVAAPDGETIRLAHHVTGLSVELTERVRHVHLAVMTTETTMADHHIPGVPLNVVVATTAANVAPVLRPTPAIAVPRAPVAAMSDPTRHETTMAAHHIPGAPTTAAIVAPVLRPTPAIAVPRAPVAAMSDPTRHVTATRDPAVPRTPDAPPSAATATRDPAVPRTPDAPPSAATATRDPAVPRTPDAHQTPDLARVALES